MAPFARAARLLPLLALVLAAGCASSSRSGGVAPGPEPLLSVERFLQASNTRDLDAMGRMFGTAEGAIVGRTGSTVGCGFRRMGSWVGLATRCTSWQDIEVRLNTIAMILEHDDYQIRGESPVAGRRAPTRRVGVDLERNGRRFADVPFVVVRAGDGRWLVEEVGLDRITGDR